MKPIYGFLATVALILACVAYFGIKNQRRQIAAPKVAKGGGSVTLRCYDGNGKPVAISDLKATDATTATFDIAGSTTDTYCYTSPVGQTLKACDAGADCGTHTPMGGGSGAPGFDASVGPSPDGMRYGTSDFAHGPDSTAVPVFTGGGANIAPCHKEGAMTICGTSAWDYVLTGQGGAGGGGAGPGALVPGHSGTTSTHIYLPGAGSGKGIVVEGFHPSGAGPAQGGNGDGVFPICHKGGNIEVCVSNNYAVQTPAKKR